MHPAMFYRKGEGTTVHCELCPHRCILSDGASGRCHARTNRDGMLYARTYGIISALALDPIEKKPLAHFHPGTAILSAGSYGCNLSCLFCQNHEISQTGAPAAPAEGDTGMVLELTPSELVQAALADVPRGNIGVAYTYNEPLVGFEFVLDTARLARSAGLLNVLVTNGYINPEPLEQLLPYIDAMNIDLKAFTDGFYQSLCGGTLAPVLAAIDASVPRCHVEVTTLIIPGHNSDPLEIDALSSALAAISADIPLHLNRHHPDWRMRGGSPVSREDLFALAEIARSHLRNVHCGNIS